VPSAEIGNVISVEPADGHATSRDVKGTILLLLASRGRTAETGTERSAEAPSSALAAIAGSGTKGSRAAASTTVKSLDNPDWTFRRLDLNLPVSAEIDRATASLPRTAKGSMREG
jgi:hypothetical protein